MINKPTGEDLRMLRKHRKMSMKEIGQELGMSINSIYRWESGLATPRQTTWEKLQRVYDFSLLDETVVSMEDRIKLLETKMDSLMYQLSSTAKAFSVYLENLIDWKGARL